MLKQALAAFTTTPPEAAEAEADGGAGAAGGGSSGGAQAGGKRLSGRVETREDVIRALDSIADYYRRSEPSHPIQPLVDRVRQWVTMDFLTLMNDIAPDGTDQAIRLLRLREE